MSIFKQKPRKKRDLIKIVTLDEKHRKKIEKFKKEKRILPHRKKKLVKLKNQLNKLEEEIHEECIYDNITIGQQQKMEIIITNNASKKAKLKVEIKKLEDIIYNIENNEDELDYYTTIGMNDLLLNYYDVANPVNKNVHTQNNKIILKKSNKPIKLDNLDKLNLKYKSKARPKKVIKKKRRQVNKSNNNLLELLGCKINKNNDKPAKNKATLLGQYNMLINGECIYKKKKIIKKCNRCNIEKTLERSNGLLVCRNCGTCELIQIDSDIPNYKDPMPDKPGYPYKRINHFNEYPRRGTKSFNEYSTIFRIIIFKRI
uniref:Uncharacterized protein n=1 Tax=Mimivirus LCMiAC02 TaxID=2506609 RepID=A0A481Z2D8_9VIRU|nr:MAG: hypothetical protein LCMiAC02_00570 [Mimivirus LCMiAC02]